MSKLLKKIKELTDDGCQIEFLASDRDKDFINLRIGKELENDYVSTAELMFNIDLYTSAYTGVEEFFMVILDEKKEDINKLADE